MYLTQEPTNPTSEPHLISCNVVWMITPCFFSKQNRQRRGRGGEGRGGESRGRAWWWEGKGEKGGRAEGARSQGEQRIQIENFWLLWLCGKEKGGEGKGRETGKRDREEKREHRMGAEA